MENRDLGDYRIIKQLGHGSLGPVYLAEHRYMKKPFALKVLAQELSSDRSFVQRFEEEIANLAALDHPHIAKVHNVSFAEGQYFLVNDCIVDDLGETTNLTKFLLSRADELKEDEIHELLSQIASALDYAHGKKIGGRGLVHRCLKPNNVLVGKATEGIQLKLCDFGLSRIVGLGAFLTRTYKAAAESLGSYPNSSVELQKLSSLHQSFLQNYACFAPEQKNHESVVDIKADVYAFGVLAYFLMTKEYPEGVFAWPSEMGYSRYDWDTLIRGCLSKDPAKRPSHLGTLLEEIQLRKAPATRKEAVDVTTVIKNGEKLRPILHNPQLDRPEIDHDPAAVFRIDTTVKQYQPEPSDPRTIQPLLNDMVVVHGGTFWRGSNDGSRDETPRHQIHLSSFAIDINPVSNEQFVRFLDAMGGEKDSHHNDIIRLRESRIKRSGGKISIESGYLKHPVVGVTWYGAVAYAKWIGKRLPTEAEWEIASRGGIDAALYPTGEEIEKSQANFFSSDTTPVMSYAPNGYGIYDMAGNVYEWCYDWYGYNYYELSIQEPENPQGPLQGVYRVLRGGCWKSLKEDLRCSRRHRNNPGTMNSTYGFRCAADVE